VKRAEKKALVHSIVLPYITAKRDKTQLGIYNRIKPGPDSRIRTVHGAAATETSRLNSSESICDPASTNLQNLPNVTASGDELYQVRDCIVADQDMILVAVDYDAAESICLAAYSKDWEFYDRLIAGEDVHSWHAGHFFDNKFWVNGQKADKVERSVSKNATFACNYMGSIYTVTLTVNRQADKIGRKVTQAEIARIHRMYLNLHPLERWWRDTSDQLRRTGVLTNCFEFTRRFYNPDFDKRLKEGLAFFPQSTVACNINRSMTEIAATLDVERECELLLQVHDELLFQVREDLAHEKLGQIISIMEKPFTIHGREIYIPASAKMGKSWGQMTGVSLKN